MAGKTKVDLKFEMTDGTNQVVSFEVPNGKDAEAGSGGSGLDVWEGTIAQGQTTVAIYDGKTVKQVSINGIVQSTSWWLQEGGTLKLGSGLETGDKINLLMEKQ